MKKEVRGDEYIKAVREFRRLTESWNGRKPIFKLFKTDKNYYLYDTGTNRIFLCSQLEYEFLNNLIKLPVQDALDMRMYSSSVDDFITALGHISDLMNGKKVLMATRIGITCPDNIDWFIQHSLGQIILETTQRCNLRCKYCIYDPSFKQNRNHSNIDMPLDIARRAIDHLSECSSSKEKAAISFYGGEPLLRFPFIKECVRYAKTKTSKDKLIFSMTTNGTLMTKEIARFLSENEFGVHVSLDGPKYIHDENRTYPNRRGSFQKVKKGIEYLLEAYGEKSREKISISMVYSPPYSEEKINRIGTLWEEPWFPKDIRFSFSYAKKNILPDQMIVNRLDYSVLSWAIKRYIESYQANSKAHPLAAQYLERKLTSIHQRYIFDNPAEDSGMNGCCYPGARKIYISAEGMIYLCERIGLSPALGNVFSGIDIEKLKRIYLVDYREQSEAECCYCWLSRLCDICYAHAFYDGAFSARYKKYNCEIEKNISEIFLKLYCRLYEIDPGRIDNLLKIEKS